MGLYLNHDNLDVETKNLFIEVSGGRVVVVVSLIFSVLEFYPNSVVQINL